MAKRPGASGIISAAVVLGLITGYLIWAYFSKLSSENEKNRQPVVVAVVDIKPRTKITREMVELKRFPADLIADNAIREIDKVVGHTAQARINPKEQLRQSDLIEGAGGGLAYDIPEGMRAISIGGDEVKFVSTTVKPGDRIDILATYHDPRSRQELTKLIMQNVIVLAVNRGETDPSGKTGANSSMVLAVKPEQTELIAAADRIGALRVSLRPVRDEATIASAGVTAKDFVLGTAPPDESAQSTDRQATPIYIQAAQRPARDAVIIYRGVQAQVEPVGQQ
jgi:pilus assembly protein CpaB